MAPLFSVVVPTYNRATFIEKTLRSLCNQEGFPDDHEILVVDDGSTDNTREVVASVGDRRIRYVQIGNGERGRARNVGARQATGEYVNFFDSDDFALPNHLAVARDVVLSRRPRIFHLGFHLRTPDGTLVRDAREFGDLTETLLNGNPLSCNAMFLQRTLAMENPFREERVLAGSEDWELWLRISARVPIPHVSIVTSVCVDHPTRSIWAASGTHTEARMDAFMSFLRADEVFMRALGHRLPQVEAAAHIYAALHLAMSGAPARRTMRRLGNALRERMACATEKRFWACMKQLVQVKLRPRSAR